jgi:hypothetical protein
MQGYTNCRHQVIQETTFCATAFILEYSAWNFHHASHQARKISRLHLRLLEILCTPEAIFVTYACEHAHL